MELYQNKDILEKTDILIETIYQSDLYQHHLKIREKLEQNSQIMQEIESIKTLEKAYVRSGFQQLKYKEQLEEKLKELRKKPLYKSYEQSLEEINQLLEMIQTGLNDVFQNIVNEKD